MTHPITPPLDEVKGLLEKATPGPWEEDRCETEDGYGKFWSRNVFDMNGKTICDMTNSDAGEVHTEYDEDGAYRFDPIAAANARLIALTPTIAAAWVEAVGEIERLRERLEITHVYVSDKAGGLTRRELGPDETVPDGIECRDETIKLLNSNIDTLRKNVTRLEGDLAAARRDALEDAAKLCDTWTNVYARSAINDADSALHVERHELREDLCKTLAAAIRALTTPR